MFGAIVLIGLTLSALVRWYSLVSVWCFFSAVASMFVYLQVTKNALVRRMTTCFGRSGPTAASPGDADQYCADLEATDR
jgi:hypothetical protein